MRLAPLAPLLLAFAACAHAPPLDKEGPPELDGEALYARGMQAIDAGDLTRAEQYLTLAEQAGLAPHRTLPWLLEICIGASRYRAALAHAEGHLARAPTDVGLQRLVASLRLALAESPNGARRPPTQDAPSPSSAPPSAARALDPSAPNTTQEDPDDPGRDPSPQPDAAAAPGLSPVG